MPNMNLILVFLLATALAKPHDMVKDKEVDGDPDREALTSKEAPMHEEAPKYGGTPEYEETPEYETKCTKYYETTYVDRCEDYEDKVCYTTHAESCVDVEGENCRAIVSSKQVRQCINVTELICGLKETIHYDVVQAVFTVQKCHKVTERVCDTVYEPQLTSKDDFQCILLPNPKCYAEDKTVYDKTCKTSTHFDCSYGHGYDNAGPHYEASAVGGYGDYSNDYGHYESKCKRTYDTKCYTTPRTVTSQVCMIREEKSCEKLSERVPLAEEKQVCHDEVKKVCELEQRQQPKQIKKYAYTKQCRAVPKKVCENADVKQLLPSCVPAMRKECHYSPIEKCEMVPKQYCYKVPTKVQKQKCETVKKTAYPTPTSEYPTPDKY